MRLVLALVFMVVLATVVVIAAVFVYGHVQNQLDLKAHRKLVLEREKEKDRRAEAEWIDEQLRRDEGN